MTDKKPDVYQVKVAFEGAADSICARAVPKPVQQWERGYLCPRCGQEGAVDHYALKPGGTVTCPACGGEMKGM
jgi:transcription elongation factor Elf1